MHLRLWLGVVWANYLAGRSRPRACTLALAGLAALAGPACERGGTSAQAVRRPPSKAAARERPPDTDPRDAMVLHFIDVGQGDATLIEFPCGTVLIDTGGELNEAFDGEAAFHAYLEDFFAKRPERKRVIDALVITHPHIDHTRSLAWTLENFEVRNVLHNGQVVADDPGSPPQEAMVAWARAEPEVGELEAVAAEIPTPAGRSDAIVDPVGSCAAAPTDPKLSLLWGRVEDVDGTYGQNPNDHSLVLRVDYGQSSVLFTGDLQMMGLSRMSAHFAQNPEVFDVDIYQVGHHGSHNATKPYFVELMSPELAVVSMGEYARDLDWTARRYGHPHHKAVDALLDPAHGVQGLREGIIAAMVGIRGGWEDRPSEFEPRRFAQAVYATGWDGDVVIRAHANGWIEVETEHAPPPLPAEFAED